MISKSEEFRAGIAFAAHSILHSVGHAHGEQDRRIVASVEPKICCQEAILAFAEGVAASFMESAGMAGDDQPPPGQWMT